jgi:hypothetical protein
MGRKIAIVGAGAVGGYAGAMQSSVPMGCEIQTLDDARKGTGARVATAAGCSTAADIAACLRGKRSATATIAPFTIGAGAAHRDSFKRAK